MINEDVIRKELSSRRFRSVDLEALRELNTAIKTTPQVMKNLAKKYNIPVEYSPQLILLIAYETFIENSVNIANRERDIEMALGKYDIQRKYDKVARFANRQTDNLQQLAEETSQLGGIAKTSATESNVRLIQKNLNAIRQSLVAYNTAQRKIIDLQAERDALLENLSQLREQLTSKEASMKETKANIDRLKRQIAEIKQSHLNEITGATIKYNEMTEQRTHYKRENEKLLKKIKSLEKKELELTQQLLAHGSQYTPQQQQTLKFELEKIRAEFNELRERYSVNERQLTAKEREIEQLKGELAKFDGRFSEGNNTVQLLRNEITRLETAREEKDRINDNRVKELETELERARSELATKTTGLDSVNPEIQLLMTEITTLKNTNAQQKRDDRMQINDLKKEIIKLQQNVVALNDLKNQNEAEIQQLQLAKSQDIETLNAIRQELQLKRGEIGALQSDSVVMADRCNMERAQCASNIAQLNELRADVLKKIETQRVLSLTYNQSLIENEAKIEGYKKIIENLESQLQLQPEIQNSTLLNNRIRELQQELERANNLKVEWEEERKRLDDEIKRQEELLRQNEANYRKSLDDERKKLIDETDVLTNRVTELETQQIKANAQIQELQTVNENLNVRLRETQVSDGDQLISMSKTNVELANAQRELKKLNNKCLELEQDLKDKQMEYDQLLAEKTDIQARLEVGDNTTATMRASIESIIQKAKDNKIYPNLFEKIYATDGSLSIESFFEAINTMMTHFKLRSEEERKTTKKPSSKPPKRALPIKEKKSVIKRQKPEVVKPLKRMMNEMIVEETIEQVIQSSGAQSSEPSTSAAAAAADVVMIDEEMREDKKKITRERLMNKKPAGLRRIELIYKRSFLGMLKYLKRINTDSLIVSIESQNNWMSDDELVAIRNNLRAIKKEKNEQIDRITRKIKSNEDALLLASPTTDTASFTNKLKYNESFKSIIDDLYDRYTKESKKLTTKLKI